MIHIYTLEHPITGEIRYVGKTNDLIKRLYDHCKANKKTYTSCWIKSLKNKGLKPVIQLIETVEDNEWEFWERYWIAHMKVWGMNLTNHKDGGIGGHYGNETSFKKNERIKPVLCFDKDGKFIAEFVSPLKASVLLDIGHSSIVHSINGGSKYSNNKIWLYKNDFELMSKEEFNTFVNNKKERKKYKKTKEHIHNYVESRKKNGNYSCSDETKEKIRNKNLGNKPPNCSKIASVDVNGKIIQIYDSIREASKLLGMSNLFYYLDKNIIDKQARYWQKIK